MKVLYFARAREIAGTKSEELAVPEVTTVAAMLANLGERFGSEFAELIERSTVMVDDEIVQHDAFDQQMVGAEMAILPPVSGGEGPEGGPGHGPDRGSRHVAHHAHTPSPIHAAILTVSDRASAGEYNDLTGPAIAELLQERLDATVTESRTTPDDHDLIVDVVRGWCDHGAGDGSGIVNLVVTNGGTGLSQRDVTPEAVRSILDVEAPGLAELMRAAGLAKTPLAALSRQLAGRRGSTIVVCVPGSVKAATESIEAVIDLLPHACDVASEGLLQ